MNWTEFFTMGGYAGYVWGSYGFAALVLLANIFSATRRRKAVLHLLKHYTKLHEANSE
jgi:heme exporter protein D